MIKKGFVTQLEKSQVKGQGGMALFGRKPPQNREKQVHRPLFIKGKFKRQQEGTCACGLGWGAGEPSQDDEGSSK